jgi:hypothetical protein
MTSGRPLAVLLDYKVYSPFTIAPPHPVLTSVEWIYQNDFYLFETKCLVEKTLVFCFCALAGIFTYKAEYGLKCAK